MSRPDSVIEDATPAQYAEVGRLMASVYSQLDGFPSRTDQPAYYAMFDNLSELADRPGAALIVARDANDGLLGAVVYFSDMLHYGSGGTAAEVTNASGLRLLAVDPQAQGHGVGRALTLECIDRARRKGHATVVLHTTAYMTTAWAMYERMGFTRSTDLDFKQESLPVSGFRMALA